MCNTYRSLSNMVGLNFVKNVFTLLALSKGPIQNAGLKPSDENALCYVLTTNLKLNLFFAR